MNLGLFSLFFSSQVLLSLIIKTIAFSIKDHCKDNKNLLKKGRELSALLQELMMIFSLLLKK